MEGLITSLLPIIGPGGVGILAAWFVYFKISSQRKETKTNRDNEYSLIEYRVEQLERNQTNLTHSIEDLQKSIISLTISVNKLLILINKESKDIDND